MKKVIGLILLVVILSYGLTAFMYFGQDDHGLMFKLQNIEEGFSQYGEGLTGRASGSPYRYMATPFAPLYSLFELQPFGYFVIGVMNYFLAALAVYFLARALTKKRDIALLTSLIFASGYVGSDTMLRLTNSYQTPHAIVLMCITAGQYKRYINKRSVALYFLALFVFAATLEGFWIRSHGVVLVILALEILYNFSPILSGLRIAPFLYLFYTFYVKGSPSTYQLSTYFDLLFHEGKWQLLLVPLRSLMNLFIPDKFVPETGVLAVGLTLLFGGVAVWLLKRRNKMVWFGFAFAVASYMVYIFHFPERAIMTTHRYATIPFVGVAIVWGAFLDEYFGKSKWFYRLGLGLVVLNVVLMNQYSLWNLKMRTRPTREFYETLTREIKVLPRGSAIYFDVADDAESRRLRTEVFSVGSAPDMAAVAYYYGIDRYDLYLPENFGELLSLVKQGKVKKDAVYTFYFEAGRGLINTTKKTREALFGEASQFVPVADLGVIGAEISTPMLLSFEGGMVVDNTYTSEKKEGVGRLAEYIGYLRSKRNYYKTAHAGASSEWKYREVWNILDGNVETSWMSDRFEWLDRKVAEVVIDLGEVRDVGGMRMFYDSEIRVPLDYEYLCSLDGDVWVSLGKFKFVRNVTKVLSDSVSATNCRYVKLLVTRTEIDDSPQIAELEVVERKYMDLDFELAARIENSPGLFGTDRSEIALVEAYLRDWGVKSLVCYQTDKYNPGLPPCKSFDTFLGNRQYTVIIPAGGLLLNSLRFEAPAGLEFVPNSIRLKLLTLVELDKYGDIPNYEHEY